MSTPIDDQTSDMSSGSSARGGNAGDSALLEAESALTAMPIKRFILTWHMGYKAALALAAATHPPSSVALVSLTRQELPEDDEIDLLRAGQYPFLTVSDRFESEQDGRRHTGAFARAIVSALREYNEGFGDWGTAASTHIGEHRPPKVPGAAPSDQSEDEVKLSYLRAMYGDGRDDGTR